MLHETQAALMRAIIFGDELSANILIAPEDAAERLAVHRATVFEALTAALRRTFSSVERLVGRSFFDEMARSFTIAHPPRSALFDPFLTRFPRYIAAYAPARPLSYIVDVARFDLAIARAQSRPVGWAPRRLSLDDKTALRLNASLRLISTRYRVDELRAVLDAEDDAALAAIDMRAKRFWFALWRSHEGVSSRPLARSSAAFIRAAIKGDDALGALDAAFVHAAAETALPLLQQEILAAPFAQIVQLEGEDHARSR